METTVLLHSSASSPRQWRALSERLEHRHRVIAPDLEEFDSDAAETASFARDCERIMQIVQERDSAVHLVGHSYGGLIALRTAFEAPQRVRSLCLVEPVCFHLLEEAGEEIAFAEIAAVRDAQTAHVSDGDLLQAARCFVAYWMGADAWEAMPENGRSRVATAMPTVARKWPGAFQRTTALSQYASLPWPTLLIRADDSTLAARRVVDLISQQAADVPLVAVPSGGHMSPVTNPQPVNAAIEAFLTAR